MSETVQGAATKYLLTIPEVVSIVGKEHNSPFIFRDEMLVNLEYDQYTAVSAIVIEDGGPLATSGITRFRNRRLSVSIWANGDRDELGNLVNPATVLDKINNTFLILDKYLQRTDPQVIMWSTLPTYACDRIGDLSKPVNVLEGGGIQIATVYYSVLI